ncbi:hypothetical protein IPZ70_08305 [Streptomyces polychromogenes]|nr:hypothetical protein [Streptomyces polychromogenes]
MIAMDHGADDNPGVALRCRDNASVGVGFRDRRVVDAESVQYAVELRAPGLAARVDGIVAWAREGDLAPFLEGIAADYQGWNGTRSWHTNARDLTVSAVFRSGGHVGLTWTVQPWRNSAGGWGASVTTWLEAGEQMASLAADIRHFLTGQQ